MKKLHQILAGRSGFTFLLGAVLLVSFVVGCTSGQPHMQSALDHLAAAKSELQAATSDKGGHRAHAIELVDEAIAEVREGITYARGH